MPEPTPRSDAARYLPPLALVGGAAAYLAAPLPVLALAGGALYVVAAALRPLLALELVVLSTPFYLVEKANELPFSPTEFLLLGCLAGWALGRAWRWARRGKRPDLPWRAVLDWPVLLFVVGALLATFVAVNQAEHARQLRVVVVEPLLFYLLARHYARGEGAGRLLRAFVVAGLLVSLYAVYQYLFTTDTIVAEGVPRARAFYGSPNNLGLYVARTLPVAVCLAVWGKKERLLYALAALPLAVALVLTFSAGAWLGAAAALVFAAAVGGKRRLALGVVLAGTALVLAGPLLGLERITSHFSPDAPTWRFRFYVWQAGLQMALDHPLLGIGMDNFLGHYPDYMHPEAWQEPNLSHPHNLVLDFWLSVGVVGLAGAAWLVARMLRGALMLWHGASRVEARAVGLALAACTVDFLVHGFFDNSYFLVDLAIIFWLSQALVSAQREALESAIIDDPVGERRGATGWQRWPQTP